MIYLTRKINAVLLIFIALSGSIFLFWLKQSQADYYADSEAPIILPRFTWDNSPSLNALMTWLPQNSDFPSDWQPIERIVIHHADTPNNDSVSAISRIQSIYRFHAVTQGWGDIGYNYIIDQQGKIYEGRYGGNGSRGAHVYYDKKQDNFNFGSIGIVLLGDYSAQDMNATMDDSLSRLVGWLAAANNLDPLQTSKTSLVWNLPQKNFVSLYNLPAVLGHKEIENTHCPGMINLVKIRQKAAEYKAKYQNYIYQANGLGKVYKLQNGARKVFANLADYVAQGGADEKIANISLTQLDLFSETRFLKYPDGSLLRIEGNPMVYLIDNGQRRGLQINETQFKKLGFDFSRVKIITNDELNDYSSGQTVKYGPDKEFLSDGQKVFYIENGKKRWISSANLFATLGFRWSRVKSAPNDLLNYLEGEMMAYPEGALLREINGLTVYLIKDKQKREFISAQSFLKNGFRWEKILTVEANELALYPTGHFITYPDGVLVRAENNPGVFLVDKGKIRAFLSAEIFLNLKYQWPQILIVPMKELLYYSQGEPMKYREGTLLRAKSSSNVYLVSGGQLAAVDAAAFKKKKYKWSQVLVISDNDFSNLYGPNPITSVAIAAPATPSSPIAPAASSTPADSVQPKIRVAIFELTTPSISFTSNSAYNVLDKNNQTIAMKQANEEYTYLYSAATDAFVKIVPQSADAFVEIKSYEDHPAWRPTLNYNRFREAIEIKYSSKSNKIWVVNELPLEDYLKGVAETSEGDPLEYQKTMTVAARTYSYYYFLKGGKRGTDEVYHLNNTTSDQLYKGYGREVLAPSLVNTVNATRGEIVVYNGAPIIAAYSSGAAELKTSGTRGACSVWGNPSAGSGQGFCQTGFGYLNGGVKDPEGTEYKYSSCSGANHCVGLSGAGTRQFAKSGVKNYQEILKYYYLGTDIKKVY